MSELQSRAEPKSDSAALELREDAVKQRLCRGRQLLQDEMAEYVERALRSTGPGRSFTV